MRCDPVLGAAIKKIGPCLMADRQRKDHLTALLGSIVSQQLSTKAAATIFGRFVALFPGESVLSPTAIVALDDQTLRSVGLSGQKVRYVRDLCGRIIDGRLQLDEIEGLDDEAVIQRLIEVKGFGRWTAEMFMIFNLTRPNVYPIGDLGLQKAIALHYNRGRKMTPQRLQRIGKAWAPWRSVATWYLWRSLDPVPVEY